MTLSLVVLTIWFLASILVGLVEFRDTKSYAFAFLVAVIWPVVLPAVTWHYAQIDRKQNDLPDYTIPGWCWPDTN